MMISMTLQDFKHNYRYYISNPIYDDLDYLVLRGDKVSNKVIVKYVEYLVEMFENKSKPETFNVAHPEESLDMVSYGKMLENNEIEKINKGTFANVNCILLKEKSGREWLPVPDVFYTLNDVVRYLETR